MRVILMYDLPSITYQERKAYIKFHRFLEQEGFIQMQESIYTKLAINTPVCNAIIKKVKDNAPKEGLIQIMKITEKQFSQIEIIAGSLKSNKEDSEERLIII